MMCSCRRMTFAMTKTNVIIKPKIMKPIKKLFAKVLLPLVFVLSIFSASAGNTFPVPETKNSIEFLKIDGDTLLFKTELYNLPKEGCMLIISDAAGNTLYSENIKSGSHAKIYRINRQELTGVYFEVRSKKMFYTESFTFNTKLQETFLVTKI